MGVPVAAIAIGAGLAKAGIDLYSNNKRRKEFEAAMRNRPEYEIPEELSSAYGEAQRQYRYGELPGYTEMMDRIGLNQSNTIRAAQESGNALGLLSAIQGQTNKSMEDLEVRNAEFRSTNIDRVMRMSQLMANARDQQFQFNEFAPWADRYKFNQEMIGQNNAALTGLVNNLGYGATLIK